MCICLNMIWNYLIIWWNGIGILVTIFRCYYDFFFLWKRNFLIFFWDTGGDHGVRIIVIGSEDGHLSCKSWTKLFTFNKVSIVLGKVRIQIFYLLKNPVYPIILPIKIVEPTKLFNIAIATDLREGKLQNLEFHQPKSSMWCHLTKSLDH